MSRRFEIGIDCHDEPLLKPFWAEALGYDTVPVPGSTAGDTELRDPNGTAPPVWFQVVPEAKVVKNRLHLDVWLPQAEEPALRARLLELGGSVLGEEARYVVLADPEGNELCLCWGDGSGIPG